MKNKCKFLLILTIVIVFLFYKTDSVIAMENVQFDTLDTNAEPKQSMESAVRSDPKQDTESTVGSDPEQDTESTVWLDPEQSISTGTALIEWLEAHKGIGGTVKLADNVVLDEDYCFCPSGMNSPSVFVDTDKYTITVTGAIELLSDNHLTFLGKPDGKSIFYVSEKGMLSMLGVAVESGQCALWQEEGAGLVIDNCHISGSIHYADTPFVVDQNSVCAIVEKGQTVNDVLPAQISCTVNRQGQVSHNELVLLSWNFEGTEKQQEERQRFRLQGSFLYAASAEPPLCTVVYNDYPLTFTYVKASVSGSTYLFRGGYTKSEGYLPITVMSEYSFDGENWLMSEERNVSNTYEDFVISFQSEQLDRAAYPNIYIRLQGNDNGTRYFSNVLRYAADNLEYEADIGGSRGGGTSIINPPDNPQKSSDDASSSDTNQTENGYGDSSQDAASDGQPFNAGATNANTGQSLNAGVSDTNEDQPLYAESEAANAGQSSYSKPKTDRDVINSDNPDNNESINRSDSDASEIEESAVAVLSVYGENSSRLPQINEQAPHSDIRQGNAIFIAIGFVLLSVIAGIVGFYVHSSSGTNR